MYESCMAQSSRDKQRASFASRGAKAEPRQRPQNVSSRRGRVCRWLRLAAGQEKKRRRLLLHKRLELVAEPTRLTLCHRRIRHVHKGLIVVLLPPFVTKTLSLCVCRRIADQCCESGKYNLRYAWLDYTRVASFHFRTCYHTS